MKRSWKNYYVLTAHPSAMRGSLETRAARNGPSGGGGASQKRIKDRRQQLIIYHTAVP